MITGGAKVNRKRASTLNTVSPIFLLREKAIIEIGGYQEKS
jgi:hypothetical protein